MGDISPFSPIPIIKSENIFMDRCDKNFVFYWLLQQEKVFPDIKFLYLNSHPCEPAILKRLNEAKFKTFLTEPNINFCNRWLWDEQLKSISHISEDEYLSIISNISFDLFKYC